MKIDMETFNTTKQEKDKIIETDKIRMTIYSDKGTKITKNIDLTAFLQKYTSLLKEKEDDFECLYFPPGNYDYYKNVNSTTYVVQTFNYREFYGIENIDNDFAVVVKTNLNGTKLLKASVYSMKGVINKSLSRFVKLIDINGEIPTPLGPDLAVKICLKEAIAAKPSGLLKRLKYSEII